MVFGGSGIDERTRGRRKGSGSRIATAKRPRDGAAYKGAWTSERVWADVSLSWYQKAPAARELMDGLWRCSHGLRTDSTCRAPWRVPQPHYAGLSSHVLAVPVAQLSSNVWRQLSTSAGLGRVRTLRMSPSQASSTQLETTRQASP